MVIDVDLQLDASVAEVCYVLSNAYTRIKSIVGMESDHLRRWLTEALD